MARKKMITRILETTFVDVIVYDSVKAITARESHIVARSYKSEQDLIEKLNKHLPPYKRAIKVLATRVDKQIYAMDETFFINHAEVWESRS